MIGLGILPLPCGCVADEPDVGVYPVTRFLAVVLCPWCAATFSAKDFGEWLEGQVLLPSAPPRPLLQFGKTVLEHCGHCDCGAPVVREGCAGVRFHLTVPSAMIAVLRN